MSVPGGSDGASASTLMAPEGNAIVYCEGAFGTPNGKTAHGLVRRTARYRVLSVIDSRHAVKDAGELLDHKANGIFVLASLQAALGAKYQGGKPTHFVIGLAPDGGRLPAAARAAVIAAVRAGLNVDCGLHDYLTEDAEIVALAAQHKVVLRDVRKPPPRSALHFFSGKIAEVLAVKVAVLGTDSAVGKRTTAWKIVEALEAQAITAQMVGTGQTAWMQGCKYGIVLDSLVNDFIAGEIEHAVWSAWQDGNPRVIVLEGQGSLMNPAYPGGFELLAAGRPDAVVMQHAPKRLEYDGFPGYKLHPLEQQIAAVEMLSGKKVIAVTVNHEGIPPELVPAVCSDIITQTGLPCCDPLLQGADVVVDALQPFLFPRLKGEAQRG